MGRIFISYRRDDAADVTGRIFDRLIAHFDRSAVFMDVDNIPPGVDFRAHVRHAIGESSVLLAIIGPDWCDNTDALGKRRLDDPNDFVRIEIEAALERHIPVIPILVRNAKMPSKTKLPGALQALAYLNAPEVRSGHDFHSHMDRLIRKLQESYDLPLALRPQILGMGAVSHSVKPAAEADAAETGRCPKCSRRNAPDRAYCAGCREPLREPCFDCGAENSCWDLYCGRCAAGLAANRQQRIEQMTLWQREIEELTRACRYDESLPRLTDMAGQSHPRFREFAIWARATAPNVQAERAQQLEMRGQRLKLASRLASEEDFEGAIAELELIPQPLLYDDGQARLLELREHSAAWQARRSALDAVRNRTAVELADEAGLADALDELQPMAALASPRLAEFAAYARQRIAQLAAELQRRVRERANQAEQLLTSHHYEEAVQQVSAIPVRHRSDAVADLLKTAQQQADWLSQQRALCQRRQAEAEQCLARRAPAEALPVLKQLAALDHPRLLDWRQWAEPQLQAAQAEIARLNEERIICERALRMAEVCLEEADFAAAAELLERVPAAIRTPEVTQLLAECRRKARDVERLSREIVRTTAHGDLPAAWDCAGKFIALRPLPDELRERLLPCLEATRTNAAQWTAAGKWADAANALQAIPAELRDEACQRDLQHAAGIVVELQSLKASIGAAQQRRDLPQLMADLDRYLQLKPHYAAGRQHLDKLLEDCLQSVETRYESKRYDEVVQAVQRVPPQLRTDKLRRLAERARVLSDQLLDIKANFRKAQKSHDIELLAGSLARLEAIQPDEGEASYRLASFFELSGSQLLTATGALVTDALAALTSTIQRGDWLTAQNLARLLPRTAPWLKHQPAYVKTCLDIDRRIVGPVWRTQPADTSRATLTCLAFSPQGDRLAVGGGDRLAILDTRDGSVRKIIHLPSPGVTSVAYSPDGDSLAVGSREGAVAVVDREGKIHPLAGHDDDIKCVTFSPRAPLLATCGDDHAIRLWDLKKFKELRRLTTVGLLSKTKAISSMEGVAFSPGGQRLLSCGQWDCQGIQVWDAYTGQPIKVGIPANYSTTNLIALRVSPNGRSVVGLDDKGELQMWDLETGNFVPRLQEGVGGFDFSAHGQFLVWRDRATAKAAAVHLLDLATGRERWSLPLATPLPQPIDLATAFSNKPTARPAAPPTAKPAKPDRPPAAYRPDSEFELTLDGPGSGDEFELALDGPLADDEFKLTPLDLEGDDIVETDFEIPPLDEADEDCGISLEANDDEPETPAVEFNLGGNSPLAKNWSAPIAECRSLAVSPDGRHVALLHGNAVWLWVLPYEFRVQPGSRGTAET